MKVLAYALSVLAIIVFMVAIIVAVLMVDAARAQAQGPWHAWQLGICVEDQQMITSCRLVGGPLPDESFCKALRDALKAKIVAGRVHCTKVLIDEERDA